MCLCIWQQDSDVEAEEVRVRTGQVSSSSAVIIKNLSRLGHTTWTSNKKNEDQQHNIMRNYVPT